MVIRPEFKLTIKKNVHTYYTWVLVKAEDSNQNIVKLFGRCLKKHYIFL